MSWLFLALLAPALDTIVGFIDKYVIEHKLKDSYAAPIYAGITALVFGTIIWSLFGLPTLGIKNGVLLIGSGIIFMWGYALYFHALARSHTSYVIAVLQSTPLFILILSVILLGERLSSVQLLGFILVFTGVMGLSVERVERRVRLNKAFYQIIIANFLFAVSAIIVKSTNNIDNFVPILAYSSWGFALGSLVLFLVFKKVRFGFLKTFRMVGKTTLAAMFLNDSLAAFSQSITFLAITLGPVALVGVLGGTQVFYGIFFGVLLTLTLPKLFHEDIAKKDIAIKLAMSFILFGGVWLIGTA
jgi:bacterial/archaeal transporter family protein